LAGAAVQPYSIQLLQELQNCGRKNKRGFVRFGWQPFPIFVRAKFNHVFCQKVLKVQIGC